MWYLLKLSIQNIQINTVKWLKPFFFEKLNKPWIRKSKKTPNYSITIHRLNYLNYWMDALLNYAKINF